jgi:hypothetical protein
MTRYLLEDDVLVDPQLAVQSWEEQDRWDGRNRISLATGTQWNHETLYLTRTGRYWLEHRSQWQGSTPSARWLTPEEACLWLLVNEYNPESEDFPADLRDLVATVLQ